MPALRLPKQGEPIASPVTGRLLAHWFRFFADLLRSYAPRLSPTEVKTAAYTAAPWESVLCDPSLGGFTVTLPRISEDGQQQRVVNVTTSANTITIAGHADDAFVASLSPTIAASRGTKLFEASIARREWALVAST